MEVRGDKLPAPYGHSEVHQMGLSSSNKKVSLPQEYFSLTSVM